MKRIFLSAILFLILLVSPALAATVTSSIGTYDTSVYKTSQLTVPVSVTLTNGTGSVQVTITPKAGLSCTVCTSTLTFSVAGTQQTSFTITADSIGTYTNPFTANADAGGGVTGSDSTSDTLTVKEKPSWAINFSKTATEPVSATGTAVLGLSLTVSDTVSGVQAVLTLPTGWSIVSGTQTYNFGGITGTESTSWTVRADSPASSNSFSVSITSTDPVESFSESLTISGTPTTEVTGGAGGGGGGGGGVAAEKTKVTVTKSKADATIPSIAKGKSAEVSINKTFEAGVRKIEISVKNAVNNIKITINKLVGAPAAVTAVVGKVYHYVEITKENITDADINKTKISFAVEQSWITANNIDSATIALNRWANNNWNKLTTTKVSETDTEIEYQAESSGLSYFAISGKEIGAAVEECPTCPSSTAWSTCIANKQTRTSYRCSAATDYTCESYTEEQACEVKKEEVTPTVAPSYWAVAVVIIIALVAGIFYYYKYYKPKKKK